MREDVKGVLAMVVACSVWGLSAYYYHLIAHVPPLEVLSHRTIWTVVFVGILLAWEGRIVLLKRDQLIKVFLATSMISVNWFIYIYGVQIGVVAQTSLGYYIFPLVAVALGAIFLGERLTLWQWVSVGLASIAVLILSIGVGEMPWISLALAITFGLYGVIKKPLSLGPKQSVFWEVMIMLPIALIWLAGVHFAGWLSFDGRVGGFFGQGWNTPMLMFLGLITGGPLVLMAYAMKRLRFATVGLVQYINPSLQFLLATIVFMEPFGFWHMVCFGLIWIGLALYSWDALRQEKA